MDSERIKRVKESSKLTREEWREYTKTVWQVANTSDPLHPPFLLGSNSLQVVKGDSRAMDFLPDNGIDLVVTSPPIGIRLIMVTLIKISARLRAMPVFFGQSDPSGQNAKGYSAPAANVVL